MHMEHTIAKDAFSGLSGNNAVYNAICIAVCDDEQFMCDMIEEKIKEMLPDAVVCKFFSAQELLDSETQIDILFLDIQMPEMDGYEAARRIRQSSHPDAKTITIIAVTANAFQEDLDRALAAGMNDAVTKPLDVAALIDKISRIEKGEQI